MTVKKRSAFLIGGLSFFVLEGIVIASFFVFLQAASSKEQVVQERNLEIPQSFPLPSHETGSHSVLDRFGETRAVLLANGTEFVEVNFSQNKVLKYENGVVAREVPVLAKGDPQGWGGTPAGLYNVVATNKNAFSDISQVYMPHAVHFYGKYFLHGEPYYPSGQKLASDVSGGCIRLEDRNAELIYNSLQNGMPVFVVDKENDGYIYAESIAPPPIVSATNYLVADVNSGFVFAEKNSQEAKPIASITKLMTALVAAENVDLRKSVKITPVMLEAYGDTDGLHEGESYRVVELFYPLLIASSNDAAEAVAGFLGRERTIQMMNEKAQAMLMRNTTFADPSGFDSGSTSSAQDLFYLARYILNNRPPIFDITRGERVRSYGEVRFSRDDMWNRNIFVSDASFVGGKTGYTTAAKHTGVFLFEFVTPEQEVRTIAFVLLGSYNGKLDTQRLYSWLQQNYQLSPNYPL